MAPHGKRLTFGVIVFFLVLCTITAAALPSAARRVTPTNLPPSAEGAAFPQARSRRPPRPATTPAPTGYDRHVAFDNSLTDKSYYYTQGSFVSPSELELSGGKFPVEEERCVSPPNCLRLKWRSQSGGEWHMALELRRRYGSVDFSGSALSFWCYSETDLSADESPLVYLNDASGEGTPSIRLIGSLEKLPARRWVRVRLPFSSFVGLFKGTRDTPFDPRRLAKVTIVQGLDDGKPHTLYIDDVRVSDDRAGDVKAPAPPAGLGAKGYDRHVDLTWQPGKEADLLHYKIYRSFDGKAYTPIGIQKGHVTRYADFIGESGKPAYYKISAVDRSDNESPHSG
ncbi:MAG: hypothetical protein ACRD68_18475, partial [Pyrinomonadaceae bacterium]